MAETKLKGMWYFDENAFPRSNLANPHNLEPRFRQDPTNQAVWDNVLNRWTFFNGKKVALEIRNFMAYRKTELIRGISIAVDLTLMTSPVGFPMQTSATEVVVATLSSDVTLGLLFRGSDRNLRASYKTI